MKKVQKRVLTRKNNLIKKAKNSYINLSKNQKIEKGAKYFAIHFEGVMKELANG